jgi:tetratricopeptide (TPR) repeat protein
MKTPIFAIALLFISFCANSEPYPLRTIEVRIALDSNLENPELWKEKMIVGMADASKIYKEAFNIEWKIKDFIEWRQRGKIDARSSALNVFIREAPIGDADVLLGVIAVDCQGSKNRRVAEAAYFRSVTAFYTQCVPEKMENTVGEVLAHEFGHLFGMFHVGSYMRSIMSPTSYSDKFDEISKQIIKLNRDYNFKAGVSSLSDETITEWAKIFHEVKYQKENNILYMALVQEGVSKTNSRLFIQSEKLLKKATEIEPEKEKAYYHLGMMYGKAGKFSKSIDAFRQVLDINPLNTKVFSPLISAYMNMKQPDDAIAVYEKIIAIQPENIVWRIRLGKLAVTLQQYSVAETHYAEAVILGPDNMDNYTRLAFSLVKQEKVDQAIIVLSQALEVDPEHVVVNKNFTLLTGIKKSQEKASRIN